MITAGYILLILALIFVLIRAADHLIFSLKHLARLTHTGVFVLSALIIALGTSMPELFVGITSAVEGVSSLALGVIIGSNITNIALIGGITAFIIGRVHVHGELIKKEVLISFLAGLLPIILVLDGNLSRLDGFILILAYCAYTASFFRNKIAQAKDEHTREAYFHRLLRQVNHINGSATKEFTRMFLSAAVLLFSADWMVKLTKILAFKANFPIFLVGLIFLALGTSLPELVFSIRSLEDKEPSMFLGNLTGSTIVNSTLVIGIATLINPVKIGKIDEFVLPAIFFALIFASFWYFIKSKSRLDRWEAGVLLSLYCAFIVVEFL